MCMQSPRPLSPTGVHTAMVRPTSCASQAVFMTLLKRTARSHTPSGDVSDDEGTVMNGDTAGPSRPRNGYNRRQIHTWLGPPNAPRAGSPTPSAASWTSNTTNASDVSTVRDLGEASHYKGTYLSGGPHTGKRGNTAMLPDLTPPPEVKAFMASRGTPVWA